MSTDLLPKPAKATKPPKQWRNRYRARDTFYFTDGEIWLPGNEYWGHNIWPSREVAEQMASETLKQVHPHFGRFGDRAEWIDAFPVEA